MFMYFFSPDQCPKTHVLYCNCFFRVEFSSALGMLKTSSSNLLFHGVCISGYQRLLPFNPCPCSDISALSTPSCGLLWQLHVQTSFCSLRLLLPAGTAWWMAAVLFGFALCSGVYIVILLGEHGFRQLEAFGESSVPKSRPRRRWRTITASLVASDFKHKHCCDYLYLINIVDMSRARQIFFCWYFTVVLLVAFSLGGCDCFGDSCVQWKWDRTGHFSGRAHGFGGAAHVPADALCHLCEGMCICGFIVEILGPLHHFASGQEQASTFPK